MLPDKNKEQPKKTQPAADEEKVIEANKQAQKDIDSDADLSIHSPNDDLDEGESARLGEDKTDLV
jgi:hypothetical protein